MQTNLPKLQHLSRMLLDSKLMILHHISNAESRKAAEIARLRQSAIERRKTLGTHNGIDSALLGGADERWEKWQQNRIRTLNTERSALRAQMAEQRKLVKAAFGQNEVLLKLSQQSRESILLAKSRRHWG